MPEREAYRDSAEYSRKYAERAVGYAQIILAQYEQLSEGKLGK